MVKYERSVTPMEYLALATKGTLCLPECRSSNEIRDVLATQGLSYLWDYPLSEMREVLESESDVLLVECIESHGKVLRWFEI